LPALTAVEGSELFSLVSKEETLLSKREREKKRPESSTVTKPFGGLFWRTDSIRVPDNHGHFLGSTLQFGATCTDLM
jgi:hypothetical protein